MTDTIQFSAIKDELQQICHSTIVKHLEKKQYNQKEAQNWTNTITDEIIKNLH